MNYIAAMRSILQLDEKIYHDVHVAGKAATFCMVNVLVCGLLYGFFVMHFIGSMVQDTVAAQAVPAATVIMYGVGTTFLMHAGAALYLWVFSRGFGGRTAFLPVYLNLGLAFIGLWPLAPFLAAWQAGLGGAFVHVFLVLTAMYGFSVIFMSTKNASGLSMARMSVAMLVTLIVVGSLLSLWL